LLIAENAANRHNRSERIVRMRRETALTLKAFVIELVVYAALMIGYFFLVLHFLGGWLWNLEVHHRFTYAGVAILLILGQAVLLESVTTLLLRLIRGRTE
jgi:hypothetical protein